MDVSSTLAPVISTATTWVRLRSGCALAYTNSKLSDKRVDLLAKADTGSFQITAANSIEMLMMFRGQQGRLMRWLSISSAS